MSDPDLAGIAGDWHGNIPWAVSQIPEICKRLSPPRIILQAGDFGVWAPPGEEKWSYAGKEHSRKSFLSAVSEVLKEHDARLWFVDGNHEDHHLVRELGYPGMWAGNLITPRILHLERGTRWTWHGRKWLALGGAVSVDKNFRTEGTDWFPEEEITPEQEEMAIMGGPADVLLSHDAPSDEPLYLPPPPPEWLPMIAKAENHRDILQRVCVAVKPRWVFHGHYHRPKIQTVHAVWGKCTFHALDCDGTQGNWGILDLRTMEWEW